MYPPPLFTPVWGIVKHSLSLPSDWRLPGYRALLLPPEGVPSAALFSPHSLMSLRYSAPVASWETCLPAQEGKGVGFKLPPNTKVSDSSPRGARPSVSLAPKWRGYFISRGRFYFLWNIFLRASSEPCPFRVQLSFGSGPLASLRTSTLARSPHSLPLRTSS